MQTSINLSIPFDSLVDAITTLSLEKKKKLMALIDKQINNQKQEECENSTLLEILPNIILENQEIRVLLNEEKQAVLIPLEEWQSIQETIYLNSIPSVAHDLIEGKNTPWKDCTPLENLEW